MTTTPDPAAPGDTPLSKVIGDLDALGFTGQFQAVENGELRCLTCRSTFRAARQHADRVVRVEGISDPADMAIVVPLRCPHCQGRGTFVSHYGPDADPDDAEVLVALERTPAEGTVGSAFAE